METLFLQLFLLVNVFAIGVLVTLAIQQARAHYTSHTHQATAEPVVLPNDVIASITSNAEQQFRAIIDASAARLQNDLDSTNHRLNDTLEKLVTYAVNAEMERYRESLDILHRQNESILRDSVTDTTKQHIDLKTKLIKRQAELDQSLIEHQTKLERQLADHQSENEARLNDRQAELNKELAERKSAYDAKQAEIESQLADHQAVVEEKLRTHQEKLMTALTQRESQLAEIQAALENDLVNRQSQHAKAQQQLEAQLAESIEQKKQFLAKQIDTKLADAITSLLVESLGKNIDLGAQAPYLTALLEEHKDELKQGVKDA